MFISLILCLLVFDETNILKKQKASSTLLFIIPEVKYITNPFLLENKFTHDRKNRGDL